MKGKKLIEWRRNHIISYSSKGCDQATIAKILHVGEATISRDMTFLKEQAKRNIQTFIDDRLPYEYNQTLNGLTAILREA
jgi:IS30 family transposase